MSRDPFEVIDQEWPEITAAFADELAARLGAGGRLTSSRNGVPVVEYLDGSGRLVTEVLAPLAAPKALAAAR